MTKPKPPSDAARAADIFAVIAVRYPYHPVKIVTGPSAGTHWHPNGCTDHYSRIEVHDDTLLDIGGVAEAHDVRFYMDGKQLLIDFDWQALTHPTVRPHCAAVLSARQLAGIDAMPDWPRVHAPEYGIAP